MVRKKLKPISIRLSQYEKQQMQDAAELSNKSVSKYIRDRLFGPELTEGHVPTQDILGALQKSDNNIEAMKQLLLFFMAKTSPHVDVKKTNQLPDADIFIDLLSQEIDQKIKNLLPESNS